MAKFAICPVDVSFLLLRVYLFCFLAYSKQDQTLQNWFVSKVSIVIIPF